MSENPCQMPVDPVAAQTSVVANRLKQLMLEGKGHDAMVELYAPDARHIEAMEFPGGPYKRITQGKDALLKMSEHWNKTTQVHDASVSTPRVNGDQFTCEMMIDATSSEGPMAGHRMKMEETCLYTVKNGLITEAKFFYGC